MKRFATFVLDYLNVMLPALLFISAVIYTAWCARWF